MRAMWLILGAVLSACTLSGSDVLPEGACANTADCASGSVCIDETCQIAECTASATCALGEYCDTDAYTCTPGCADDSDCLAGEACDTFANTCVSYGCRDTQLDCGFGEVCDPTSGQCVDTSVGHCEPCHVYNAPNCGAGALCEALGGGTCISVADCPSGYSCDDFTNGRFCHIDFCMQECVPSVDECPRGLLCGEGTRGVPVCAGNCEFLLDNGF
ncbi:MAG: hypothetical protein AAFV53_06725 [Myxococcota bacterium]